MIDPRISMAISVQSRKGVYALLLGSGISRPASIPTGWEVVTDLIRRVASLANEPVPDDPQAWYRQKFGIDPTYSGLLGELAHSAEDRSQLLREYFEPTDDDRETGKKMPTAAHKAIARLIRDGYIQVIVTTNFDRMLEQALHEEGMNPKVISSEDAAQGTTPLQHADCTIFKVHGDYLDLQTRNTKDELAEYGEMTNALLDRIFSEYGLIVAGWSGDWDEALRMAIIRNTRHRFSTFWMSRNEPGEKAREVIDFRDARIIEISSADESFTDLEQKIKSIEESRTAHPLSGEIALATAKRLLSEDRFFIQLESLVMAESERLTEALNGPGFDVSGPVPNEQSVLQRAEHSEAIAANLSAILMAGCYWGTEKHHGIWQSALSSAISFSSRSGNVYPAWEHMRFLPAAFILYHAGIACCAKRNYRALQALFSVTGETNEHNGRNHVLKEASCQGAFHHNSANELFPPSKNRKTPGSDWLHSRMRQTMGRFLGNPGRYDDLFNRFELLLSMSYFHLNQNEDSSLGWSSDWMPEGRYIWQRSAPKYTPAVFREELERERDEWGPLKAGFFDSSPEQALAAVNAVEKCHARLAS